MTNIMTAEPGMHFWSAAMASQYLRHSGVCEQDELGHIFEKHATSCNRLGYWFNPLYRFSLRSCSVVSLQMPIIYPSSTKHHEASIPTIYQPNSHEPFFFRNHHFIFQKPYKFSPSTPPTYTNHLSQPISSNHPPLTASDPGGRRQVPRGPRPKRPRRAVEGRPREVRRRLQQLRPGVGQDGAPGAMGSRGEMPWGDAMGRWLGL